MLFGYLLIPCQRLVLLAEAAERCKSLRAWDLPPSASDAVVQLRVMGDYSITSEDDDGVDEKVRCAVPVLDVEVA